MKEEVTQRNALDMQVCVPTAFTDEQVSHFAETNNPCGTANGWSIRREGNKALMGCPERQPCAEREGFVHIMLDA